MVPSSEEVSLNSSAPKDKVCNTIDSSRTSLLHNVKPAAASDQSKVMNTNQSAGWTTYRRNKRRSKAVTGVKKSTALLKGVQPMRDIYVGRCDKSVTVEIIKEYIQTEFDIEATECLCLSVEESKFKSFKITVRGNQFPVLLNADRWPEFVCVRKYFVKNNIAHGTRS